MNTVFNQWMKTFQTIIIFIQVYNLMAFQFLNDQDIPCIYCKFFTHGISVYLFEASIYMNLAKYIRASENQVSSPK